METDTRRSSNNNSGATIRTLKSSQLSVAYRDFKVDEVNENDSIQIRDTKVSILHILNADNGIYILGKGNYLARKISVDRARVFRVWLMRL